MALYFFRVGFIFTLIISGSWCEHTEQIVITEQQSFSFDCKLDESVYFGQRLGDWSHIKENHERYYSLNLKFNHLTGEKILRVTSDSARSENVGFYGCRKSTHKSMSRIYHLIMADVQSFYWTHICHAPAGACIRSDDPSDETLSTFEVADKTNVDLYCCASATGYKHINIKMNHVGEGRSPIDMKEKQELDGSWVVCASQHTVFKRISSKNQQMLTCDLVIGDLPYSSFASVIVVKDAMPSDPDMDLPYGYTTPSKGGSADDDYFNGQKSPYAGSRGTLTRKQTAIIISSVIGSLVLFGLLFCLTFFLCRKKKALTKSTTNKTNKYPVTNTNKTDKQKSSKEKEESTYLEPIPLYVNSLVFQRV